VLKPTPKLPDGRRFKVIDKFKNAVQSVRLSTGERAPALTSYGAHDPIPEGVETSDYLIKVWRFPAMRSLWSKDFHVVFDYPRNLYTSATAMSSDHNFRLKDYIATSTHPTGTGLQLHGKPGRPERLHAETRSGRERKLRMIPSGPAPLSSPRMS